MKKILSIILALTMVLSLSSTAFATKALGVGTRDERVAAIQELYGITVEFDWNYIGFPLTEPAASNALSTVEAALPYLGNSFIKNVVSDYEAQNNTGFCVTIAAESHLLTESGAAGTKNGIRIYANLAQVQTSLHEFAHIWDYSKPRTFSGQFAEINGPYNGYVAGQYVSHYAATKYREDFAETFMHMVYYGGSTPNTAAAGSVLYKKKMFVLDYLIRDFGAGSNATRRAAAHMGIDLATYTAK